MEDKKLKKIERIAKDEEVVVEILSEDLQDLYEKMMESNDNHNRAKMDAREDRDNVDLWRISEEKEYEWVLIAAKFWYSVKKQYGLYGPFEIGIRDGYAVVKEVPRMGPEAIMKKMLGGS